MFLTYKICVFAKWFIVIISSTIIKNCIVIEN